MLALKVKKVKADIALPAWEPHGTSLAMGSITQCYLPSDTSERALPNRLTPAMQAGTRFTYPGGMEG